ncbi:MAG TPA: tRNA (guanosine(37)-N1)-methyltransferase TrmD [Pseudomonadales bacterium]|nr:tRNA (guanosine(37)-N1)-methyltransferase TrmD [Pseudomonadales bacterium]HND14518.1 tRNA (guanosine(37)-N1)-methyltransferase TrmD [Pseudomonadales bacterium]
MLRVAVVTIFPEMFDALTGFGVSGRAVREGLIELKCWNPRDYASDRHRSVDDRPYGGGPGMVMSAPPLCAAIRAARGELGAQARVIYLSPQGVALRQQRVEALAQGGPLVLLAGRYEGVDERVIESEADEEISLGDYVLSGGELPAMVLLDAMIRLLPGALGHDESAVQDSFAEGLLDCPHYTRPEVFEGRAVPPVLLSGDHERIRAWRLEQACERTRVRRPDLAAAREEH